MNKEELISIIEKAWNEKDKDISYAAQAIEHVIEQLDLGEFRVSEKKNQDWFVNEWVKRAILLSFKLNSSEVMDNGILKFHDKLKLKFSDWQKEDFTKNVIRAVPGAIVRKGAFLGKNVVVMPSFINIGAYIDDNTLIDSWATVGSCAQIGKNCHISGGVGIGGVLEPIQASPVIIEDNCFIGARSEIAEGVRVGEGSVISMGIFLSQSTRIYNRLTKEISYGYIPPYSVVVPGTIPSLDNSYSLNAAIIVKQVDASTRSKTSINDLLRL